MHTYTLIGIILIGIATVIGTYLIHKGNLEKGSEKNTELLDRLEEQKTTTNNLNDSNIALRNAIDKLAGANEKQLSELDILRSENSGLRDKLSETKSEVLKSVLGGDSYGQISALMIAGGETKYLQFYVQNMGKYPMYDVTVAFSEVEENAYKNPLATIESVERHNRKNIGNIAPQNIGTFGEIFPVPESGKFHYRFTIISRNGVYHQQFVGRMSTKDLGLMAFGHQLKEYDYTKPGHKIISESFNPDFPEEERKKIKWE